MLDRLIQILPAFHQREVLEPAVAWSTSRQTTLASSEPPPHASLCLLPIDLDKLASVEVILLCFLLVRALEMFDKMLFQPDKLDVPSYNRHYRLPWLTSSKCGIFSIRQRQGCIWVSICFEENLSSSHGWGLIQKFFDLCNLIWLPSYAKFSLKCFASLLESIASW